MSRVEQHRFYKRLFDIYRKVLAKNHDEVIERTVEALTTGKDVKAGIPYDQWHQMRIFHRLMTIASAIDRCQMLLLWAKRQPKFAKHTEWISVIIGALYVHIGSISDLTYKLVNEVLWTGNSGDKVDHRLICTNDFVKGTALSKSLNKLHGTASELQSRRNEIVHEYRDSFMKDVVAEDLLFYYQAVQGDADPSWLGARFLHLLKKAFSESLSQGLKGLRERLHHVEGDLLSVLDNTELLYDKIGRLRPPAAGI